MFRISNKQDLRIAYEIMRELIKENRRADHVRELKQLIREYYRNEATRLKNKGRLIYGRDGGVDGYILLIKMPKWVETKDDAEIYYEEVVRLTATPSQYDCTGQHFSWGHCLCCRNGEWWVYDKRAIDI